MSTKLPPVPPRVQEVLKKIVGENAEPTRNLSDVEKKTTLQTRTGNNDSLFWSGALQDVNTVEDLTKLLITKKTDLSSYSLDVKEGSGQKIAIRRM